KARLIRSATIFTMSALLPGSLYPLSAKGRKQHARRDHREHRVAEQIGGSIEDVEPLPACKTYRRENKRRTTPGEFVSGPAYTRSLGPRRWRSQSPTRLMPRAVRASAAPGNAASHHAT